MPQLGQNVDISESEISILHSGQVFCAVGIVPLIPIPQLGQLAALSHTCLLHSGQFINAIITPPLI